MLGAIYNLKLSTGQDIVARLYDIIKLDGGILDYVVEYPMLVSENISNGISQTVLHKYMQFSDNQMTNFKSGTVICMSQVTEEFAKYYYNSIAYNSINIDRKIEDSIRQINESIQAVIRAEPDSFTETMKKYNIDPDLLDLSVAN